MKVSELRDLLDYAGDDDEVIVIKDDSYFHPDEGSTGADIGSFYIQAGKPT